MLQILHPLCYSKIGSAVLYTQEKGAVVMKRRIIRRMTAGFLACVVLAAAPAPVGAEVAVTQIPNTDRTEKAFDTSFLSVTGFAKGAVNDRSEYLNTDWHRKVSTEEEFLQALDDARSNRVKIIEITEDLDLGYDGLSEEAKSSQSISAYGWDIRTDITNPAIKETGVSQLTISDTTGLTIFSRSGVTIRHAEWKLQGSSSDLVIRNIKFDGMWQWSDAGSTKEAGWSLMKVNGAKGVWLDHCTFTLGADGNADLENGASGVTYSWCTFSLPTDENPYKGDSLYQSVMYMEYLYQNGLAAEDGRYYQLREQGVSVEQILAYEAYHSKAFLVGSGDKDYKDNEKTGQLDGNQRLRITFAYNKINNIGQRFPRLRQGTAHMYNCYVNNMEHMKLHKSVPAFQKYGGWSLNRLINAQNGAVVGADTCVFYGVDEPIICSEVQGPTTLWFKYAINHVLVVNSELTKTSGETYTGSSWDNNGENLFNGSFVWSDKSTIGKWAWFSHIVGEEDMEKANPPAKEFEFTYDYDVMLPYSYQTFPLASVRATVDRHAGAYTYNEEPEFWVRTDYSADEAFLPVDTAAEVPVESIELAEQTCSVSIGDTIQILAEVKPSNATEKELTYISSDPSVAEVWDCGLVIPHQKGTAIISVSSGNQITATYEVEVYQKVTGLSLESRSKTAYVGTDITLDYTITPEDATNQNVTWTSSKPAVASVDEDGTIHPLTEGKTTITCKSEDDPDLKATCTLTVKEADPVQTEEPTKEPERRLPGDVNGDGAVDASDALCVLKHAARIEELTMQEDLAAADMNGDHTIDAEDALQILKTAAQIL